ncbi:MAG: hypothetical protein CL565_02350 [Alphaproteobacteria bacterium]|nr:hypothetical protein [Alphaproteobacteria bacterium]|tara:strand:- start:171 stop:986 length:816 start_codon:yes stop_codon:yes gene_type:complete
MSNLDGKKNYEYCRSLVKNYDYDRYLISLFASKEKQPALWSLYAFNYEIAKTREIVTETQLGLIRLQWWREALDPVFSGGEPKSHQVLKPLAEAIFKYKLPKDPFETLIYAREFDLEDVAPDSLEGLVNYCEFTNSPLILLAMKICGIDENLGAAKHLGIAYGLTGQMRAILAYAREGRAMLPADLIYDHEIDMKKLFQGMEQDGLPKLIKTVSAEAERNLELALTEKLDQPLKAQAKLVKAYLKTIRKADYNPFSIKFERRPATLPLRLF